MRFLVLGGNGYLGSKIVNELSEKKHRIVATRRVQSDISRVTAENIFWIPAKAEAIKTAMLYEPFDWIINMACNYGRSDVLYDDCIAANLQFPLEVLNLAAEFGVNNYLTIGTGLPDNFNMYTMSKKMFAGFGEFYADRHNINFTSMKLEMFYGADEPSDRFIPSLIVNCRNNNELRITLGTQRRDIIAIQDVVRAILFTIEYVPKGYNEIPVGTGTAPSIREIVEFIHSVTNSDSEMLFGAVPMREGEPDCVADTGKLAGMGFSCKWSWKPGLEKMINEMF
ncbi:MAG TPA: hypothetical protein DDY31_16445 [Lachnospiraceae bacterium]|nr:hypothetical protein [Lachnospiraceae bacterium]HBI62769.1 hypothetical protein [Lachnospiraceae bacterium]